MSFPKKLSNSPNVHRREIRLDHFTEMTSGLSAGFVQGNIVILPKRYADDFLIFCQSNPQPCPVIGVSEPGNPLLPMLGDDIDIRTDVPEYYIFEHGKLTKTSTDLKMLWQDDFVAIVLGCSFSFEEALQSAGYVIRNIESGLNVSMYDTNIPMAPSQYFSGNMVVSMRPFKAHEVLAVQEITSKFPKAHGAPVHIGDPAAIGIAAIDTPQYGDAVPIAEDEVPVFWACGVSSQNAVKHAKLPIAITHAPGKMLITDKQYSEL